MAPIVRPTQADTPRTGHGLGFGHWACGWFETAIVRPGSAAHEIAIGLVDSLDSHPVLDEHLYQGEPDEDEDEDEDEENS